MRIILTILLLFYVLGTNAQQNNEQIIIDDTFPYENTMNYANEHNDKVLMGAAYIARGEYYELHNKRREAIREYKKAYSQDQIKYNFANDRVKRIKSDMEADHRRALSQIYDESEKRGNVFRAIVTAGVAAAEIIAEQSNTSSNTNYSSTSSSSTSSSSTSSINNSTIKRQTCPKCRGQKICIGFVGLDSQLSKMYCRGKIACQACGGRGEVRATYGQTGWVPCVYCNSRSKNNIGDGICGSCHGTGVCSKCNGQGYL